ncbi:MAG: permease prefix domain 1-containing protein [Oscillospiraceae bacterium]|nr:permease prefix domain 1-containing protein [Oscillospiraceae bacterium]
MEDKIRRYIDDLFLETAPTKKAVELKEEMIQNLSDKYNDLTAEGKTPEAAYNITIAGIGDISALLAELEKDMTNKEPTIHEMEASRQKSALLTAIAVMMYILCALPIIIMSMAGFRYTSEIGVPILFLMIAGATGLLVYNSMIKNKYRSSSDTMVEDFREWQSDDKDRKALRKAISSALWSITVALYLIISFVTFAWYITWIIFIIAAAIESLINVFYTVKKGKR